MVKELFELKPTKYGHYSRLEMLEYFVKERNFSYVIYGAGNTGRLIQHWIERTYNLIPAFYIDKSPQNAIAKATGIPIYSLEQFVSKAQTGDYFVLIALRNYNTDSMIRVEIDSFLEQSEGGKIVCRPGHLLSPFKIDWWNFILDNAEKYEYLYNILNDSVSRETLIEYLKTYVLGQRYNGKTFLEKYKYWGIDSEEKRLFNLTDNEILLNIGASIGDTLVQYLKCKNPYKKIIAVEADEKRFFRLKQMVENLDVEEKKRIQIDNIFLKKGDTAIDRVYENENISLINMDIEGGEIAALESGKELIIRNRPILAICAYHKVDDLITIPDFVQKNLKDYVFALRKYPSPCWEYIDGIHQISELVLYAIPKERILN